MMSSDQIAKKLQYFIQEGESREVQLLLDPIVDIDFIRDIEEKFIQKHPGIDPLNFAIDHSQEEIAIYLVEKSFALDRVFQWADKNCDQWCYFDHGLDNCPSEYTASDNAERKNLYKLKNLIDSISSGKRKPGQSLSVLQIPNYVTKYQTKDSSNKMETAVVKDDSKAKTLADEARELIDSYGPTYVTKNGDTLMHLYRKKPKVFIYIFASRGVPVNIQNTAGDTALHLSVREGLMDTVEALLQCSADLTMRNKMGIRAVDEVDPSNTPLVSLLNSFKPGLVAAVTHGDKRVVDKFKYFWCNTEAVVNKLGVVNAVCCGHNRIMGQLVQSTWCSVNSIVKEGRTLLKFAETKAQTDKGNTENCYRILKDFRKTSMLIHAVLCEDADETKRILKEERGWSVNYRFRDRLGKTLLSTAIESNNIEIVRALLENGARILGIRVREDESSDLTVPLFQKAIHPDIDMEIAKFLNSEMKENTSEHFEKDSNGNTALLRAIDRGCSPKFIHWLLTKTKGCSLTDRNKDSLNPKELAQALGRDDIVKTIDKFILTNMIPTGIPQFSSHFWKEKDLVTITEETTGRTLSDIVLSENKFDVKKWINFHDVHNYAVRHFEAVAIGNETVVAKTYDANYQDRNGYTALIRAIVYQQHEVCRHLCITRPILKSIPDNCNRYPLHYAYALPEYFSKMFVGLLLEGHPEDIENKVDKNGKCPADYVSLRNSKEIQKMLYDARTLDVYGKRGPPLGPWPQGALKRPPDEQNPIDFLEVL